MRKPLNLRDLPTRLFFCLLLLDISYQPLAAGDEKPKSYYQLDRCCHEFTEALVTGKARQIYRMFVPGFQSEIKFSRFDSALSAWSHGRRIVRARSKVVDIRGLGGHVSSWIFFKHESDYSYVYQSWLHSRNGWNLVWLSNILNQSFQYGRTDTAELEAITQAALNYIVSPGALKIPRCHFTVPDTIVVLNPGPKRKEILKALGHPVIMLNRKEIHVDSLMLNVPFYFEFAFARVFGEIATCTVDLRPTVPSCPGLLRHHRSIQLFLERKDDSWQVQSVGKVW